MDEFQHITVGGRLLRVHSGGDASGTPIVYLHGGLGSIHERPASDELVARMAIRLVRIERPGFGASTRHAGRTLAQWADDVSAVLDALGVARAGMLGWSGGAPHALAVAACAPARVAAVALVGGGAQDPSWLFPTDPDELARAKTEIEARTAAMAALAAKTPIVLLDGILGRMPEVDRVLPGDVRAMLAASYAEALRTDGGAIDEMTALRTPWPFDPATIACPVHLWTGELDQNTPPAGAHRLAELLPRAVVDIVPGRGHNMIFSDAERILAALRDEVRAAGS
jgi:pimeloyl-ACP methyl ester carboxylesterase